MCKKCGQDHDPNKPCPPKEEKAVTPPPLKEQKKQGKHQMPKQIRGDSREEE